MTSDARAKELLDVGDKLFTKKEPILSLWQEIADQFYPERADFLDLHYLGEEFARDTMDSYPLLMRRELGNNMSAWLRPRDKYWFKSTTSVDRLDKDSLNAQYLDYKRQKIHREMYKTTTGFIRSTKTGDHDFVTFGQTVISVEQAPKGRDHLFYRGHHLRDCAWADNEINEVDNMHRKDKMTARQMKRMFKEGVLDQTVKNACKDNPIQEFNIRCITMPSDEYDYIGSGSKDSRGRKLPFITVYVDADNAKVLKEVPQRAFIYCVPRWHMVTGSPYAFSPCTVIALPDGRMAQAMGQILLEAGEKAIDPPVVAVEEAVREVNLQAGKITWADFQYDGKLNEAVQPIPLKLDMKTGFAMRQDLRDMLAKSWFIDKIMLPESGREMTAYETARRLEEFVRNLLPLFEPMEVEYNARLLTMTYNELVDMGRFPHEEIPQGLRGQDFEWGFENTLQESRERAKVAQFQESLTLMAAGLEAGAKANPINVDVALKDAIMGTAAPAAWHKTDEQMIAEAEQKAAQNEIASVMAEIEGAAGTAGAVADAAVKMSQADASNVVPFKGAA